VPTRDGAFADEKRNAYFNAASNVAARLLAATADLDVGSFCFEIKFKPLFQDATACKITKNVDSQQHDHLKTHKSSI